MTPATTQHRGTPKPARRTRQKKRVRTESEYVLRLYVAGATERSIRAIQMVREVCEGHLKGHYSLEVVDIYQQPVLAKGEQIIAVPTLIKKLPSPLRHLIGDMSDIERVLVGLDLKPRE